MWIFRSFKSLLLSFSAVVLLVSILFWLYLNIIASMQLSADRARIELPDSLPTKIHVGNYLETQLVGILDTQIHLNHQLLLPLTGRYLANLQFEVETPISVSVNYQTIVKIDQTLPLRATTDLVYQNKFLPQFPLSLDIPIQLEVPFQLKKTYAVPVKISFNGPVFFEFNEAVDLHVLHQFAPQLKINDPMTMRKIATFNATMYNQERNTTANLDMSMNVPIQSIRP